MTEPMTPVMPPPERVVDTGLVAAANPGPDPVPGPETEVTAPVTAEPEQDQRVVIHEDPDEQDRINAFRKKIMEQRTADAAPKEVVKAPLTGRQKSQIELEQEAGRRAVARHHEQYLAARPKAPDKSEGTTVVVPRDGAQVPGMFSRDPAIKA